MPMRRFRPHALGMTLAEALDRTVEVAGRDDIVAIVRDRLGPYFEFNDSDVVIAHYAAADEQSGWDAIDRVSLPSFGVMGFVECLCDPRPELP